jgi:hypothetical protein
MVPSFNQAAGGMKLHLPEFVFNGRLLNLLNDKFSFQAYFGSLASGVVKSNKIFSGM